MITLFATAIFVIGYLGISLEHKINTNKSAIALVMGGALWLLIAVTSTQPFEEQILESAAEIFEIVVFLLAAMSLVEILVHYHLFDVIRGKIFRLGLDEKKQFLVIATLAFFLSAIIDNLTTTIVMVQISRKFFKGENLLIAVSAIIIAANAGGAFSPIGDVTTIILWLAGKFSALEIIARGFLPSFTIFGTALFLLYRKMQNSDFDAVDDLVTKLRTSEVVIISIVFATFTLPVIMGLIGLPPYIGLIIGLGVVWIVVDLLKKFRPHETHLTASIDEFIKKTDISSLMFFIGILLGVSALHEIGALEYLSKFLYGDTPEFMRIVLANVALGPISAVLDNVPLTAIALDVLHTDVTSLWILLAIAVGTGGSILIVGSAAGVVAMGMVKELHFGKYLEYAAMPAAVGFAAGMLVWYGQYLLLTSLGWL